MKQSIRIKCTKVSVDQDIDCVSVWLVGCNAMDILDQLLDSACQQDVVRRVNQVQREWREMEEIDQLVDKGL